MKFLRGVQRNSYAIRITGDDTQRPDMNLMKTRSALIAGLTALLMMLAGPAGATTVLDERRDPQDVRGRLDIVLVRAAARGDSMVLTVRTAERWGCRYINGNYVTGEDHRSASLRWQFNKDADPYTEDDGFFSCTGNGKFKLNLDHSSYRAWRPNRRTIKVAVPAMRHPNVELHAISRVDQLRADGPLIDEEDVAPGLRPNR